MRTLVVARPGEPEWRDAAEPSVEPGGFVVDTLYSGISAGTELSYLKGTNPYLASTWDADAGVFRDHAPAEAFPITRLGYMEVARVRDTDTDAVAPGDVVAMTYGHASAYAAHPSRDRFVPLPNDVDPLLGVYVAHMGPICANGLLHAAADLVGRDVRGLGDGVTGLHVLVTGAGVVGLLTGLFALHHGAASVTVADPTPERLAAARELGLEVADEREVEPWSLLKRRLRHGPGDCGADVAFQCRGRDGSLAAALRSLRPQGTVIDLAFYQGGAAEVRLGEEFHHNGLALRCAQIGRVPAGLAPAWTRERLSHETIGMLRAHGAAVLEHIITDVVAFADAPAVIADLAARRRQPIQAVFAMGPEREMTSS